MEWMRNEKVFFCQDQNNSNQVFFIVPAGPSAISQATISLFDLTICKKKKNYLNINISKSSSLLKAEKQHTWRTKLLEVVSEDVLPSDPLNRFFLLAPLP